MKVWIVVLALLLLFGLIFREHFESEFPRFSKYVDALADVRQKTGYVLPTCDAGYTLSSNKDSCEKTKSDGTKEKKQPNCPAGTTYAFRETEGNCEPNDTETPSETMIDPDCPVGYTFNRDSGSCEQRNSDGVVFRTSGTCPDGNRVNDVGRCTVYGDGESTSSSGSGSTCPDGYTLAPSNAPFGLAGKCTKSSGTMPCPQGEFMPGGPGDDTSKCVKRLSGNDAVQTSNVPTCPSGQTATPIGCMMVTDAQGTTSYGGRGNRDREVDKPTGGSWSGSLGGGSSGNLIGPTSGGVGARGKKIWGPVFVGLGQSSSEGGDSTKSNTYPGLLGGMMGKQSARIDEVGIVPPSQFGLDLGVLPSSSSLGTDANARFLPFARQPGDTDFSADPYRLAKSYSTKNYSPQPEPVPFLTDFSAFFR